MRILKFKSQLTIVFFAAVNHLNGPLGTQNFTLTGSKGHGFWFVIGGFRSVLCVSLFQGSLLVIVIMIDGSEKRNCEGGLWALNFVSAVNFRTHELVKSYFSSDMVLISLYINLWQGGRYFVNAQISAECLFQWRRLIDLLQYAPFLNIKNTSEQWTLRNWHFTVLFRLGLMNSFNGTRPIITELELYIFGRKKSGIQI